jgi:hypothetical protein
MTRDTLILLHSIAEDPAFPGQLFYCEHCVLMEGVLACFPKLPIASTSSACPGRDRGKRWWN